MSEPLEIITVYEQPIELCKLLKIANLVAGGGEAKIVISEGYVLLNGEVEFRKRKKVVDGDIVEFNGECIQVHFDATGAPSKPEKVVRTDKPAKRTGAKTSSKPKTKQNPIAEHANENPQTPAPNKPKRRTISF